MCADEAERSDFVEALTGAAKRWPRTLPRSSRSARLLRALRPVSGSGGGLAANHVLVGPLTREELKRAIELRLDEPACGWSLPSPTPWWRRCPTSPEGCRSCRPRSSSCGRPARTGGSGWKPMNRPAASVARSHGSPRPRTSNSHPPSRRRQARVPPPGRIRRGDRHASTGRARRVRPCTRPGCGGRADPVHARPAAHEDRGHGGGGPRGPAARVASPSGLAGRTCRAISSASTSRTRPGNGRRPAATPRRCTGGSALRRCPGQRPGPDLNEVAVPLGESPGERARRGRQRRTNRRLRGLLAGTAVFLVVALLAGGLALVQRGRARDEAVRAESGPDRDCPRTGRRRRRQPRHRSRAEHPARAGGR